MRLNKLIKLIRKLSDEEYNKLLGMLDDEGEDEDLPEEDGIEEKTLPKTAEGDEVEEDAMEGLTDVGDEGGEEYVADDAEESDDVEEDLSNIALEKLPELNDDEDVMEMEESELDEEDEIEDEPIEDEPIEAPDSILDEEGEEMPVDYQGIIDGLNAKILALLSENRRLKAKCEGAFGTMAKPRADVKRNALYDDDVSDVKMMKI